MSTIAPTQPITSPAADWIPSPLMRLTVAQYEALIDADVLTEDDRVELINGHLVNILPPKRPHVIACDRIGRLLGPIVPTGWHLMPDVPVQLPATSLEPQPDVAVVRGRPEDYPLKPPAASDLSLVEVSSATKTKDRKRADVYGGAGIPVYWIVNLIDRQVEVYTGPALGRLLVVCNIQARRIGGCRDRQRESRGDRRQRHPAGARAGGRRRQGLTRSLPRRKAARDDSGKRDPVVART